MDNLKKRRCKVSVYVSSEEDDLCERHILESPKSIFVPILVNGADLMNKISARIADSSEINKSVEYTFVLTDMNPPEPRPSAWTKYSGRVYFSERARVSRHFYAEDLLHVIYDALELGGTPCKIYGIEPLPKRGALVSNDLVNQIRDELGF